MDNGRALNVKHQANSTCFRVVSMGEEGGMSRQTRREGWRTRLMLAAGCWLVNVCFDCLLLLSEECCAKGNVISIDVDSFGGWGSGPTAGDIELDSKDSTRLDYIPVMPSTLTIA